jgi:preprotein translocase subunit SecA
MGKFQAVVQKIKELNAKGQPVLVGTVSIDKNEVLSRLLEKEGVPHKVLNAKQHEKEGSIVAQAGAVGAVTVATNMAGRGVDIILGGSPFDKEEYDKVVALGGLFVMGTERHESRRIDNQLRGRAGRQGDPGVSQFCVSMEDDLMRIFGSDRIKSLMQTLNIPADMPIENRMISKSIENAQRRVEDYYFDTRKHLVEYDDVMNKQREAIYRRRDEILAATKDNSQGLRTTILEMVEDEIEQVVSFHTAESKMGEWNLEEVAQVASTIFPVPSTLKNDLQKVYDDAPTDGHEAEIKTRIIEHLMGLANVAYDNLTARIKTQAPQQDFLPIIEKEILLRSIDNLWVDHLDAMSLMRTGIGLRGYAQRDPLVEYKAEARNMYLELQNLIQKQVVYSIFKIGISQKAAPAIKNDTPKDISYSGGDESGQFAANDDPYQQTKHKESKPVSTHDYDASGRKIGRNDPCPCGSSKKYKKCHGA